MFWDIYGKAHQFVTFVECRRLSEGSRGHVSCLSCYYPQRSFICRRNGHSAFMKYGLPGEHPICSGFVTLSFAPSMIVGYSLFKMRRIAGNFPATSLCKRVSISKTVITRVASPSSSRVCALVTSSSPLVIDSHVRARRMLHLAAMVNASRASSGVLVSTNKCSSLR